LALDADPSQSTDEQAVRVGSRWSLAYREKIEDYLRFLTHAGETRFPIFACGNLGKLCHFVNRLDGVLTLTLEIV